MAPLDHSGDVAPQWQVGQSHWLCQLHRQITASCPAHLQDTALPPLVQLRRLRLQKAVPSRATQGCAARWSPLPATAPPAPPVWAAAGTKSNHSSRTLGNAKALRYYYDYKNTTNYGFMRLSCPSGIPSYPAISKRWASPELIRPCSPGPQTHLGALGGAGWGQTGSDKHCSYSLLP